MLEKGIEERYIFIDAPAQKNSSYPRYISMKKLLKKGDVLYINSLKSLGVDYETIIKEWKIICREIESDIVVLDNETLFDSRKFRDMGEAGKLMEDQMLSILEYVSSTDRNKRKEIQKKGIEAAQKAGVRFGRPPVEVNWELFDRVAIMWCDKKITAEKAIQLTGVSKTKWYKHMKERGFYRKT